MRILISHIWHKALLIFGGDGIFRLVVGFAWIVVLLIGWMFKRRHDRQLAENTVTECWIFEGGGKIGRYVGGYHDARGQQEQYVALKQPARAPGGQ